MTQAAFKAVYIDAKALRGLKVVRFMFDVAVEDSTEALTILGGFPRPDEPVYVGIAPIKEGATKAISESPKPANSAPKESKPFSQWTLPQQVAMRCNQPLFRRFLEEHFSLIGVSPELAAAKIREYCGVASRAEILPDTQAANRWLLIESSFQVWVCEPEHVA